MIQQIAECAPLAVESTRATARVGLVEEFRERVIHEFAWQVWLAKTEDHLEGVRAVGERRLGEFKLT
ncbi:hypothetical protein [Marinobacter sp.]|uniref:hypothetical protein n=1 Tax=Marinobacter sp. TaxID=50741 RepID=UPI003A950522